MKKVIKLNEAQLHNIIKEAVVMVLNEETNIMPSKYENMFRNIIRNAVGCGKSIELAVADFYRRFKGTIPGAKFTPENLLDMAEDIQFEGENDNLLVEPVNQFAEDPESIDSFRREFFFQHPNKKRC